MAGALYLDDDQATDLRANTAIAQAKDDWYQQTAPDRAVDQAKTDYYTQRAADDAVAQTRTDYYTQRSQMFGNSLGPPPTQAAGDNAGSPPAAEQVASSPSSQPVPPAASGPSPTLQATPQASGGQYSPYDEVFKKYAGDLASDPEFIKVVAAGTKAESQWNTNSTSGDGGHSWGLFQMHDQGMGAGMGNSRLDPDAASAVMVPRYAQAYRLYTSKGLTGAALAAAVGHAAELNADASGSGYAKAYNEIGAGGSQPAASNPVGDFFSNVGSTVKAAADKAGQAAGNVASTVGNQPLLGTGAPGPTIGDVGNALSNLRGPALRSDEDLLKSATPKDLELATTVAKIGHPDDYQPSQAEITDQLRSVAEVDAVAMSQMGDLSARLNEYPANLRAQLQDTANKMGQQGKSLAEIGDYIQQWMGENPVPGEAGLPNAPETEVTAPAPQVEAVPAATVAPESAATEAPEAAAVGAGAPTDTTTPVTDQSPNLATTALSALNETKRSIYALSNVHAGNMTRALLTSDNGGPSAAATFLKDYATSTVKRLAGAPIEVDATPEAAQWEALASDSGANWLKGSNPDVGAQLVGNVAGRAIGGATTGAATAAATYNATQGDPEQAQKTFMAGATGAVLGATLGPAMHDALFKDAMPKAATALFRAAVEGGTAPKEAATYVNNLFGTQNLEKILGSQPMAQLARLGLQAPAWLFSEARLANSAILGGAKTAIPGATPTANQALSRNWYLKTLLTYGAITEATQFALTGHFTNENSAGSEFQVEIPTGQKAPNGSPANMTFGLFPGQAQQVLDAAARISNNPASGAAQTASDRVNRLLVTAYDELANEQYYNFQKFQPGPVIVKPNEKVFGKERLGDSTEAGLAKRAEFAASQFAPISATGPERELQYGAPLPLIAGAGLLGIPMSENSRPQRTGSKGAPAPARAPLPTPTSPVIAPLQAPRTRIDLLRAPRPTQ